MSRDRDQEYDNTNTGVMFENDSRSERAPQWRGSITVRTPDGEILEYWVSCWEKETRKGPTMSLALDLKDDQRGGGGRRGGGRDRDDDRRSSRGRDDDRRGSRDDDRRSSSRDRDIPGRDGDRRSSSRSRDDERGDPRDRDDERRTSSRSREDDPPRENRKPVDRDLDDEVPFS